MNPEDLGKYYESLLDKEVRKEGGIYYTPPPIVDYMIADSLGALLQDKAPEDATKIKIVDPTCGGVSNMESGDDALHT
jgi:adenine-specific DNA-methyltransferase